ncbi:hypothetical protein BDF21DRAFT_162713 [Thamnidium elegans]|nr:hypothetical protein BDF21DRAFT_162713 [Thamnidium elegans]
MDPLKQRKVYIVRQNILPVLIFLYYLELINAVQSTYLCTPYRGSSIDMIQAVARQYKFAVKVTKGVNWDSPDGIIKGIRHYSGFLAVIHDNPSIVAVPTYEIDLAWHTHMLHASNYRRFCNQFFSRLINHDDTIPEDNLKSHVEKTDLAWKQRDTRRMISQLPALPPSPTPSIIESSEKKKGKSIKKKIGALLSFKKKGYPSPSPLPVISNPSVDVAPVGVTAKDIYCDEKLLFGKSFVAGTYKEVPSHQPISEDPSENLKEETDELSENQVNQQQDDYEDLIYDKDNISFHDKRDIKDFIKFKNSDKMMDKKFKDAKVSVYGFIGTSNCGNTSYLDQWDKKSIIIIIIDY